MPDQKILCCECRHLVRPEHFPCPKAARRIKKEKARAARIVEATSVEDYLDRYYKPERYGGRGDEYSAALLDSYRADYARNGYVCTSKFDNITGEFIAWPHYPNKEV